MATLRARLVKILSFRGMKEELPVWIMILSYTLVFSFVTITNFYALRTYAYDLGNYNQALYTTLRGYGFLYYTADLPVTNGSMMGVHFSPILLIILPIYAVYPAPPTLLALKSFTLALGAFPLYQLAKHVLKTRSWGLFFAAIYLLNPALQGINWFDFHPEAFFPTFFLFSLYYGLKGGWLRYVLFSLLTLTTGEYAAILVFVNSLYMLWEHKEEIKFSFHPWKHLDFRNMNPHQKYPLITMVLAILWFIVALQVVSIFSPNPMVKGGATQWSILGADSIPQIPLQIAKAPLRALLARVWPLTIVTVPQNTLAALLYDWAPKLVYLLILFGSVAFLCFLNRKSLIITLPWFTVALLSNYYPFYYIGDQYPAFLLPPIMIGSILGTKRFLEIIPKKTTSLHIQKTIKLSLLALPLIFSFVCSPLYGLHLGTWPDLTYGFEPITEHDRIVMDMLSLIPQNSTVLTQQNIFPLLSSRKNSYVIPLGSFYPPGTNFSSTLNEWLQKSDFVLVDLETSVLETYLIYTYMKNYTYMEDFGVYASSDRVILLKRNYSEIPIPSHSKPYEALLNWSNLTLLSAVGRSDSNRLEIDWSSNSTIVFFHPPSKLWKDFWRGPPIYLPPGEYEATFKLKVTGNSSSKIVISVSESPLNLTITKMGTVTSGYKFYFSLNYSNSTIVHTSRELLGGDFSEPNAYEKFTLKFSFTLPSAFEFSGTGVSDYTGISLDWIRVTQLNSFP